MMQIGEKIFLFWLPECAYLDEGAGLELVVVERIQHSVHGHQLAGCEAGHLNYGSVNASYSLYVYISDQKWES